MGDYEKLKWIFNLRFEGILYKLYIIIGFMCKFGIKYFDIRIWFYIINRYIFVFEFNLYLSLCGNYLKNLIDISLLFVIV